MAYYALVCGLAVALLCSLYALVSQPQAAAAERANTQAAESTIVALRTQIAQFPLPTRVPYRGGIP